MPARVVYRGFRDVDETLDVASSAAEIGQWLNTAQQNGEVWLVLPRASGEGNIGLKIASIKGFMDQEHGSGG